MKPKPKEKRLPIMLAVFFIAGMGMISFSGMDSVFIPAAMIGLQTASANRHYGILGQPAPEIGLDTWIDENGKKTRPLHLNDYRGKVVFLYFFQDW